MNEELSERELLWRQYKLLSDLYAFYLDLIVKANFFFYAITGAIIAFVLTNRQYPVIEEHPIILLGSFALPIVLSSALAVASMIGRTQAKELEAETRKIRDKLSIGLAPHVEILVNGLLVSGFLYVAVTIGLVVLLVLLLLGVV